MQLAIDYTAALAAPAGIGYLTKELTKELIRQHAQVVVFTNSKTNLPGEVIISKPALPAGGLIWMFKVGLYCRRKKIDYLVSPTSLTFPLFFSRVIQVVNDLSPLVFPKAFTFKQRLIYRLGLRISARFAQGLVFISQAVQVEFDARYKSKARKAYAHLGLNEFVGLTLAPQEQDRIALALKLPAKYFCSISTLELRKNYEGMIRGFAEFSRVYPDYEYLIVGKRGWLNNDLESLVKELGLGKRVRFLGYLSDAEKWVVLKQSSGFMYVSHYEGFGLPNIEAYALGVSVLTSDIPVMHEVMQDKAYYAKPKDFVDIGNKLKLLVSTRKNVDTKFLQRFSWTKFAKAVVSVCR